VIEVASRLLAGWIVLGERLTMSVLLGGLLVIASIIGVLVLNRSPPEGD
jgi:threonine/homoserine efflux transporter RhtA